MQLRNHDSRQRNFSKRGGAPGPFGIPSPRDGWWGGRRWADGTSARGWGRLLFQAIGLCVSAARLCAADQGEPARQPAAESAFAFRNWDSKDGLPSDSVTAIAQTADGFLWVGTDRGLVRFDGMRFETPPVAGLAAFVAGGILELRASQDGGLLIAANSGLVARLQSNELVPVLTGGTPGYTQITGLAEEEGAIWLATDGRGVWRCGARTVEVFDNSTGLPSNIVPSLERSANGELYIGTGSKVLVWRDQQWQFLGECPSPGQRIDALATGADGSLWVAVPGDNPFLEGARILRRSASGWSAELEPYPWAQNSKRSRILALLRDRSGKIWAGTESGAVYYHEPGVGWQPLQLAGRRLHLLVSCLFEDQDGSVWVGAFQEGLYQLRPRAVTPLTLPGAAGENLVKTCFAGRDGGLWIGTDGGGVFRYERGAFKAYEVRPGLPARTRAITAILEDRHGTVWAGSYGGFLRLESGRFEPVTRIPPLRGVVMALFEDRSGTLWIGSSSGLIQKRGEDFQVYGRAEGFHGSTVRALAESPGGELWVAVSDGGLFQLRDNRLTPCRAWPERLNRYVRNLHCDSEGVLWIATLTEGLFRLQGETLSRFNRQDGLPDDTLKAIVPDDQGNLWISSDNGIFGLNRALLRDYVPGRSPPLSCRHLSLTEGLVTRICSGEGQPMGTRTADGRIWFPNRNSLAVFSPGSASPPKAPGPVVVQEVSIAGVARPVSAGARLSVPSNVRRLEFRYSSPDLSGAERLRFRYRLEGLDREWVEAGNSRVAAYSQLRPGTYRFRVRAAGRGGDWIESLKPVELEVLPMFWETWWFRAASVGMLTTGVGLAIYGWQRAKVRRRLRQLETIQAVERERQRIAQDLHDEVGAVVSQLTLLGEFAGRDQASPAEAQKALLNLRRKTQELARQMDVTIWAVNPRNDSLPSLASHLQHFAAEFFEATPVRCRVDVQLELPELPLAVQVRHALFMAVKEALNNVGKHSGAGEVWLRIHLRQRELEICVEDDGCGFDAATVGNGRQGLENMRRRLSSIGGSCEVDSSAGRGCCVRLRVAIERLAPGYGITVFRDGQAGSSAQNGHGLAVTKDYAD